MQKQFWFGILLSVVIFAGCGTIPKEDLYFHRRLPGIHRVVILPPHVEVNEETFQGQTNMIYQKSEEVSEQLVQMLSDEFRSRGLEVVVLKNNDLRLEKEGLADDLGLLLNKYGDDLAAVHQNFEGARTYWDEFPLSVGAAVNPFVEITGTDALVFAWATGNRRSKGRHQKDVLKQTAVIAGTFGIVIPAWKKLPSFLHVALVDGDNGDFLWANFTEAWESFDIVDSWALQVKLNELLSSLPDPRYFPTSSSAPVPNPERPE
ncbi:MAG: hypothetical protein HYZ83_05935 [Candidatus Omnitrophica bacterium]|nr:hypothetical protein [Candidatus Omnitrophota bacterium]